MTWADWKEVDLRQILGKREQIEGEKEEAEKRGRKEKRKKKERKKEERENFLLGLFGFSVPDFDLSLFLRNFVVFSIFNKRNAKMNFWV